MSDDTHEEMRQIVQDEPEVAAYTLDLLMSRMELISSIADPKNEVHFVQVWHKSLPDELKEQLIRVGKDAATRSWQLIQAYETVHGPLGGNDDEPA